MQGLGLALSGTVLTLLVQAGALPGIAMREVTRGDHSNIDSRRETIVRTPQAWAALWREHDFDRPAPMVDFSREMVAAVFLGSQTTAGHAVRITAVAREGDGGLVVRYRVSRPAAGAVAAQVLTFPHHMVAVPAHPGPVRFEPGE